MKKHIFDTSEITLVNGIKLITIKRDTQISSVHVGINIGALYEREEERGIAHFIEHMLFKGTKNRDNEALNNELENLGGEYNAYTDYNCTVFSSTTLSEEVENSIKLLADLVSNSTFPREQIEKERGVIVAEIKSVKDDLEELSFEEVNKAAFTKSPLKCDVIGKEKYIRKMTREELVTFYNTYYVPNNCCITIVSNHEHEYIKSLIEKYFGHWKEKDFVKPPVSLEKNLHKTKISYKKDIEQSTIVYLYSFDDLTAEEELALRVLNHKLGESSNSILFRELREERGLAYDIYTMLDLSDKIKTLYIYTSVSEEYVEEAIDTIDNCICDIMEEKVVFDDNTINLMKKVFKTAVASTAEDSTDLGNYVLHQAMEEEYIYQFVEDMKNMDIIRKEDLYNVARKVLQKPTVHILLPEKSENDE